MKGWCLAIILVLVLLAMNSVNASIIINGPAEDKLNFGDKINIDGYILRANDLIGFFKLNLVCEDNEDKVLLIRSVSLRKDIKYEFGDSLPVTPGNEGGCYILGSLEEAGKLIESSESKKFKITNELIGSFELKSNKLQVGREVSLKGEITKLDEEKAEGIAIIYFKKAGVDYMVDSVNVKGGKFEYVKDTTNNPSGVYDIIVEVNDIYGNNYEFNNISKLTLISEIYIFAKAEKENVIPGSTLKIIGEAKTILQEPIENGKIRIYFLDKVYESELRRSKFEYALLIPENIKSGKHIINVTIEDELGNRGGTESSFNADIVPTELKVELNKQEFNPGDNIILRPLVFDQAGDLIKDAIEIEVVDAEGKSIYSITKESNENVEFMLSKSAAPGNWKIKTSATGIKGNSEFSVNKIEDASYMIRDNILYINNIGNVPFKKTIEIKFSGLGKESMISKKVSLKVNQSISFELGNEVEAGAYDISVDDKLYKDISITGEGPRDYTLLWWSLEILGAVIIVLVLALVFIRKRRSIINKLREGRNRQKILKDMPRNKPEIKERELSPEEKKQKNIKEFRDMLLKNIDKREQENEGMKLRREFQKERENKKDGYI